ncbi:DUF6339 family protein [Mycolicibacterium sediminis]|uniref:DUF6339 family protein n=1 Tax=Mycolicibacterium sediminis TaxID=1286180 RepID=UPI0013D31265|nr:DUF6339 family protein [Mycolicibacterium sediminis]
MKLASEYGMPGPLVRSQEFEGRAARLLHQQLPMTPHEAAHEGVWSYLTCCWLLDVAVWRFGPDADKRRFIGDINRNTFRRMWWRAEVLGEQIDLTQLGEDELVNIMERPTIAADRRLARAVAREFLARVDRGATESRMLLMREAMKRLLRLTPFLAFPALTDDALQQIVENSFNAAAAGLAGDAIPEGGRHRLPPQPAASGTAVAPPASPNVVTIQQMTISESTEQASSAVDPNTSDDFDTVAQVALDIARRTGRVTNEGLRAVAPITADEARAVFRALMDDGRLVRRGVKLGTHYVIPDLKEVAGAMAPPRPASAPEHAPAPTVPDRSGAAALRRLLRRDR